MIALLLSAQIMLGTLFPQPSPELIALLEKRGLSTYMKDFPDAIDEAFAKRDKELVLAFADDMTNPDHDELFADQIISLYERLPEDDFKVAITVPLAGGLAHVDRVVQSKWACYFYSRALKVFFSPVRTKYCIVAEIFLNSLASRCGLSFTPFLVKGVLAAPDGLSATYLGLLVRNHWDAVTPVMAFHIWQRYGTAFGETHELTTAMMERATPLLNAKQLPAGSSRDDLLKQLDAAVEAEGKKLCDQYGNMPYVPLPPAGQAGNAE